MAESTRQPLTRVNTFYGGMNTDTDDSMLKENQYREARNMRITTMQQNSTGSLHDIEGCTLSSKWLNYCKGNTFGRIIKVDLIRDYGIVITKNGDSVWYVHVFEYDSSSNDPIKGTNTIRTISKVSSKISDTLSTVTRYEDSDNIKIYIADGSSPIRVLNIAKAIAYYDNNDGKAYYTSENQMSSYKGTILEAPTFIGYGNGDLKAGKLQYGYTLSDKNGVETEVSDLTKPIDISSNSVSSSIVHGYSEDKSAGVSVKIKVSNIDTSFERIKIIAVYYYENGQVPKVYVLSNSKISSSTITYETSSLSSAISTYTVEEFNSITGTHIVPSVIETKNNYLFASNVTYQDQTFDIGSYDTRAFAYDVNGKCTFVDGKYIDGWGSGTGGTNRIDDYTEDQDAYNSWNRILTPNDTASAKQQYGKIGNDIWYGGNGKNISYRFVVLNFTEDSAISNKDRIQSSFNDTVGKNGILTANYYKSDGTSSPCNLIQYNTSSNNGCGNYANPALRDFKTLQRDEIYRYGIVFYDSSGNKSVTKWIADIRIPSATETGFDIFTVATDSLYTHPIGIEFKVSSLPTGAVAYQIVRVKRSINDISIITQGMLSNIDTRPTNTYTENISNYLTPSTHTSLNFNYELPASTIAQTTDRESYVANRNMMCFTPEYSYLPTTYKQLLKDYNLFMIPISFVASTSTYELGSARVDKKQDTAEAINGFKGLKYDKYYSATKSLSQGHIVGDSDTAVARDITAKGPYYIKDTAFCLEPSWNDYAKRYDFITSINSLTYNNWARTVYGTEDNQYTEYDEHAFQGPGGRAFLANINYDDFVFSNLNSVPNTTLTDSYYIKGKYNAGLDYKDGTFICNFRRAIIPYGGCTYTQRSLSSYIASSSIITNTSSNCYCFDGDMYIGCYNFIKIHRWVSSNTQKLQFGGCYACSVPVESFINLSLTQGPDMSHGVINENVQIEASDVDNEYTQEVPFYTYNTAYSMEGTVKVYTAQNELDEYNKSIDTRTYYSNAKSNDELTDSWVRFQPLNYLDVDTRYGPITQIRTFNNDLVFWQTTAVGKFSVKERSMITDNSNMGLILGTGDVLARYDYLATVNGMRKGDLCDTQSDNVLYWFDYDKNELCIYSGGDTVCISKKFGVQNYLNTAKNTVGKLKPKPAATYDKKYNEALLNVRDNESIVYSEQTGAFSSIYDIPFEDSMMFSDGVVLATEYNLFHLNHRDTRALGTVYTNNQQNSLNPYLWCIVNENYNYIKVFDNCELANTLDLTKTSIVFNTDKITVASTITGNDITDRECSYRLCVPRYDNATIGNRYRGRVLNIKVSYSEPTDIELSYITTFFRVSLS